MQAVSTDPGLTVEWRPRSPCPHPLAGPGSEAELSGFRHEPQALPVRGQALPGGTNTGRWGRRLAADSFAGQSAGLAAETSLLGPHSSICEDHARPSVCHKTSFLGAGAQRLFLSGSCLLLAWNLGGAPVLLTLGYSFLAQWGLNLSKICGRSESRERPGLRGS